MSNDIVLVVIGAGTLGVGGVKLRVNVLKILL